MTCVNGDLRKNNILFRIPNFCICDPIFERNYDDIKNNNENIVEKNIVIIICYFNNKNEKKEKKIENITNKSKVFDIKKKFAELMGIDMNKNKIRMFYKGIELLDDNLLFYDKIDNMAKIQCLVSKID